jgi:hypothetical protein
MIDSTFDETQKKVSQFHFARVGSGIESYISKKINQCPEGLIATKNNEAPPHCKWVLDDTGDFVEVRDYITEYDVVDSKRRRLYAQMSDPLYSEAYRAKDDGDIAKYEAFKAQADAAVVKIKSDNPWPTPPKVL